MNDMWPAAMNDIVQGVLVHDHPVPDTIRLGTYIARAQEAIAMMAEDIRPWLTKRCDECNGVPMEPDGEHVMQDGYVVVGCEGYWHVNPNALGMNEESWNDWRTIASVTTPAEKPQCTYRSPLGYQCNLRQDGHWHE